MHAERSGIRLEVEPSLTSIPASYIRLISLALIPCSQVTPCSSPLFDIIIAGKSERRERRWEEVKKGRRRNFL